MTRAWATLLWFATAIAAAGGCGGEYEGWGPGGGDDIVLVPPGGSGGGGSGGGSGGGGSGGSGGGGSGDGSGEGDPATGLSAEEQALLDAINAERAERGIPAVTLRDDLVCAAARHSLDIGERRACTHTGSDGSEPGDRVRDCGGPGWSGEIVACGYGTPAGAVGGWLSSPGHRQIMLDGGLRRVGVAMHENYWTAIFDR